jgi:DNA polymerase/3'-5' exonuclease PolX
LALKYADDVEEFMPRSEIDKYKAVIAKALKKADPECAYLRLNLLHPVDEKVDEFEIMGSYRRGAKLSSDIDLVITHPFVSSQNIIMTADRT